LPSRLVYTQIRTRQVSAKGHDFSRACAGLKGS
jgi:hypothetical protein